ncbi:hypothetical protein LTR49_027024 [Elasticomyces elasticus]|nr:hypothetical protein LTR49_027024 [Elasticomyces elasticus]KAK5736013.1 hypothetical protein LTS12_026295 [Elasticomyces elasticus]
MIAPHVDLAGAIGSGPNFLPSIPIELLDRILLRLDLADLSNLSVRKLFLRLAAPDNSYAEPDTPLFYNEVIVHHSRRSMQLKYSPWIFIDQLQQSNWSHQHLIDPPVAELTIYIHRPLRDTGCRVVVTAENGVRIVDVAEAFV